MPDVNPYESPQSEQSTIPQARSAPEPPAYPSWVTHAIELQMLSFVLTGLCAVGTGCSTAADETWRWLGLGLEEDTWRWAAKGCMLLIEVLAIVLLRPAIKFRVYWLLISELSLIVPAAIGFIVWVLGRMKG